MGIDNMFADGKSETGSFTLFAGAGIIGTEKPVKQLTLLLLGYAGAFITDADESCAAHV
jgi:hypothetical protein